MSDTTEVALSSAEKCALDGPHEPGYVVSVSVKFDSMRSKEEAFRQTMAILRRRTKHMEL